MEAGAVDPGGGGGRESVESMVRFVMGASVAQRVSGAEVCEALEDVEWDAPFAGGGLSRCGNRVGRSDVGNDGMVIGEGDCVTCSNDVVHANEGGAEAIGDKRCIILADLCVLFHGLCFHVAVSYGRAWWCGADVVFPWCAQNESTRYGGHHCPGIYDGVWIVGGDVEDVSLGTDVSGLHVGVGRRLRVVRVSGTWRRN